MISFFAIVIFAALGALNIRCCLKILLGKRRTADYLVQCLVCCLALVDVVSTAVSSPTFVLIYRNGKWKDNEISCYKDNTPYLMYIVVNYFVLITFITMDFDGQKQRANKQSRVSFVGKTIFSIALSFSCLLFSSKYSLLHRMRCNMLLGSSEETVYNRQDRTGQDTFLLQLAILVTGFVFISVIFKIGTAQRREAKLGKAEETLPGNDKILFAVMMLVSLFSLALSSNMIFRIIFARMTPFLSFVSAVLPPIVTSSIPFFYEMALDSVSTLHKDCMPTPLTYDS